MVKNLITFIENKFICEKHDKVKKVHFPVKKGIQIYYLINFQRLLKEIICINILTNKK